MRGDRRAADLCEVPCKSGCGLLASLIQYEVSESRRTCQYKLYGDHLTLWYIYNLLYKAIVSHVCQKTFWSRSLTNCLLEGNARGTRAPLSYEYNRREAYNVEWNADFTDLTSIYNADIFTEQGRPGLPLLSLHHWTSSPSISISLFSSYDQLPSAGFVSILIHLSRIANQEVSWDTRTFLLLEINMML